jgi:iron complex outermembrane recepter protein
MRVGLIATVVCLFVVGLAAAADVEAAIRKRTDIPAERLDQALQLLAKERGLAMAYRSDIVGDRQTSGASGNLTREEALTQLLSGTGLIYRFLDESTVTIVPQASPTSDGASAKDSNTAVPSSNNTQGGNPSHALDPFRLAHLDQGASGAITSSNASGEGLQALPLEEIVVTAQKRAERLQDVPVPVTAISAATLIGQNQLRLRDYYASVPGLSISSNNLGDSNLSIRGVTTGGLTNPTVGITVDDVPFGSTTALGSRTAAPDIDPSDLDRVEVLRGPQGTLYGASSLGGLLKFVTVEPSTDRLSGRIEGDVNGVQNGHDAGFSARAAVNLPLGDALAIRASGFLRRDPGYIDDPALHVQGVNRADVSGGRFSALWRTSDSGSLKLSALFQDTSAHGAPYVSFQPALADLQQNLLGGTGGYNHQIRSFAATVKERFAGIDFISISGYSIDKYHGTNDLTGYYGALSDAIYQVAGTTQFQSAQTKKFTQELRFSGTTRGHLDWLAGLFYTHEDTPTDDRYFAVDTRTLATAGPLFEDAYPTTYSEYAAFADLTYRFTEKLDVQVGGRESENRQRYEETYSGPLFDPPAVNPPEHTKDHSFTYLLTPRYRFSPNLMVYARVASGYRPGGPNPTCVLYPVPCQYAPDKTRNYELGLKAQTQEHRLSFDASVYYIDWRNIQLQVAQADTEFTYFTNASKARSQGLELSSQARPIKGLTISGWVAFNDAKLVNDLPPDSSVIGTAGDRLPFSGRFSGNLSVQQEWSLNDRASVFAGASVTYTDNRQDVFEPAGTLRFDLPGYTQTDLHAGLHLDDWTINVFLNNLTDRRGILSTGQVGFATWVANYIQPRTAGVLVSRNL